MDRAGLSGSTAAHTLLVLPGWFPQYHSLNCNSYLKYPILLHFTPNGQKTSGCFMQLSGKETAGIQMGGEEEANSTWPKFHLTAQCPATARGLQMSELSTARKLGGNSHMELSQFSPAWPRRKDYKSFPSFWGWCKIPHTHAGFSSHEMHQLSAPHFTLHLTQSPGLEKGSGIRDHGVFFIKRNSSLSRKILHRKSVVDF